MQSNNDKTYLSFTIQDFELNPQELTKLLGINPTEAYAIGDMKQVGQNQIQIKHNLWQLKSPLPVSASIEDHAIYILNMLESHQSAILKVSEDSKVEFSFAIYYQDSQPGIYLESDILKRISRLKAAIDFDLYFIDE